ncbi:MAG: helix-turn-helix transcriptional regulator, partial [Deltaproteobacteria bacterium]|nr:helix-turn-helix transcriptional regulator [Deltaproteobacteria bacterium]
MVSRRFVEAVKLAPKRAYRIAQEAGLHPTTLSKIMNGIEPTRPNDSRILAVAGVLGLDPKECFEEA